MKILPASMLAVSALLSLSSCKTVVVQPTAPTTRTTTTEETIVHHPNATTTETEVRRY